MSNQPNFLDIVRNKIRLKHYSIRTEEAYASWIKRYMGRKGIEEFLTDLDVKGNVIARPARQCHLCRHYNYPASQTLAGGEA